MVKIMKILGIGQTTLDKSYILDDFPIEDSKVESRQVQTSVGGPVAAGLLLCKNLGHECQLVTKLGSDQAGAEITAYLHKKNIRVASQSIPETPVHTYLVNNQTGTRTGIKSLSIKTTDLSIKNLDVQSADVILLDRHHLSVCTLIKKAVHKNTVVIMDPSTDISLEVLSQLRNTTLPILPIESIKRLHPHTSLTRGIELSSTILGSQFVITAGGLGSLLYQSGKISLYASLQIKAVDALGAGDVYRAALALALAEKKSLPDAIRYSNLVAGLQCSKVGNGTAIPQKKVIQQYQKYAQYQPISMQMIEHQYAILRQ